MEIIPRAGWGARAPRSANTTSWSNRKTFRVHYSSANKLQTVRAIQDYHMETNGWSDIGYNFLVDYQGRIYHGRGWDVIGAHAAGHNTESIGVCHIGKDGDHTPASLRSIRYLYDLATARGGRALAMGVHRDVNSTDCPGDQLAAWVKAGMHAGQPIPGDHPTPAELPELNEDGRLGPLTVRYWQVYMGTPADGVISTPSKLVRRVQEHLNSRLDGADLVVDGLGIHQDGKPSKTIAALQRYLNSGTDGNLSAPVSHTVRVLQQRLNAGTF